MVKDFAVVEIGKQQYLVSHGDELLVPKINDPDSLAAKILLAYQKGQLQLGEEIRVKCDLGILEPLIKGEKIRVATYKAKSRYRKVRGFRAQYSKIKVSLA